MRIIDRAASICESDAVSVRVPLVDESLEGVVVAELPKTSSEKIEKYKLREWAEQRMSQLWDREAHGIELKR